MDVNFNETWVGVAMDALELFSFAPSDLMISLRLSSF